LKGGFIALTNNWRLCRHRNSRRHAENGCEYDGPEFGHDFLIPSEVTGKVIPIFSRCGKGESGLSENFHTWVSSRCPRLLWHASINRAGAAMCSGV
jgi:hypothetical protein